MHKPVKLPFTVHNGQKYRDSNKENSQAGKEHWVSVWLSDHIGCATSAALVTFGEAVTAAAVG